ncbi:MAG TPA: hypothetical protein VIZ44_07155 [Gaiellaceae bacterium]
MYTIAVTDVREDAWPFERPQLLLQPLHQGQIVSRLVRSGDYRQRMPLLTMAATPADTTA